jgi:hypothetical protein
VISQPHARERSEVRTALLCALTGLAGFFGLIGTASAEPVWAVVEMFTSQGCAACRAADPIMRDLAGQSGVVVLTLPVTYWDYLGWQDTFALRIFNERQRAYAYGRGARQVVTPQAVVNGGPIANGSSRPAIERVLREANAFGTLPVPVTAEVHGAQIVVEVGARSGEAPPGAKPRSAKGEEKDDVWLVPLLKSRSTKVEAGENGGRIAAYVNIARGLQRLGTWTGLPAHFEVPVSAGALSGADGWVVLVQHSREGRSGRILGAAKGPGL